MKAVALDAYDNARFLCDQYYLTSPELQIELLNCKCLLLCTTLDLISSVLAQVLDAPITIVYTPSHLYHILFELFKNAMRAVVELHGEKDALPPINITIVNGKEDLTIKVRLCIIMSVHYWDFDRFPTKVVEFLVLCETFSFTTCILPPRNLQPPG